MAEVLTNEERFVASCASEGEVGVRQKLNTGRYSERKTVWAGTWLDKLEGGKSDATRAEEKSSGLLKTKKQKSYPPCCFGAVVGSGVIVLLAAN